MLSRRERLTPSQLLVRSSTTFVRRPASGDSESTGFDDGSSEMEGVIRGIEC